MWKGLLICVVFIYSGLSVPLQPKLCILMEKRQCFLYKLQCATNIQRSPASVHIRPPAGAVPS